MRLTLILLAIISALTMSVSEVAAQDGVPDAAENVAENAPEAADTDGDIGRVLFLIFLVVFPIAFLTIRAWIRRSGASQRTRAVEGAASELDLTVQPEGDPTLYEELSPYPLFNIGIGREMRNLIVVDTDDVSLLIFDYKYLLRSEEAKREHWQTVVAIRSQELQTPIFNLYPEGFFSKIGGAFGGQDIDFDDHPEFSNAFVLKSEDEDATREFFNQPLLDFFAQHSDVSFEARPGTILYFRSRKPLEPTATGLSKLMEEGLQAFHAVRGRVTE